MQIRNISTECLRKWRVFRPETTEACIDEEAEWGYGDEKQQKAGVCMVPAKTARAQSLGKGGCDRMSASGRLRQEHVGSKA